MDEYKKLKKEKLVNIQRHPSLPLNIIVYTPRAHYERKWTKELVMARGLVVDDSGEILSRPLPKFFNDFKISGSLPTGPIEVFEKMDGSLILMFFVNGEKVFTTKGSFVSEQAIKAEQIFEAKYAELKLDQDFTYCLEVIYPENRIVVDYESEEDLFLVAKIHTKTGKEEDIHDLGFRTVKQFASMDGIDNITGLKALDKINEEGFVIKFGNSFRIKLKFETYVKLHRVGKRYSEKQIWNYLQNDEEIPLENIPDEEFNNIETMKKSLMAKFELKKGELIEDYKSIKQKSKGGRDIIENIKLLDNSSIIFNIHKENNCDKLIWKLIKP